MEETLKSFGVDAKVVNVISGPSVTRYEIQPQIGVKVQNISGLRPERGDRHEGDDAGGGVDRGRGSAHGGNIREAPEHRRALRPRRRGDGHRSREEINHEEIVKK